LINGRGETFMSRYHQDGDLAPRDVVARGIVREVEAGGGPIALTLAHLDAERVRKRFPTIAAMCLQEGIDIATDRIPVGPAAHYLMGGIDTDVWGRTSVPGLFAAGETACTGVHGANRLASNSLLEGLVYGARAARAMLGPVTPPAFPADRMSRPVPAVTPDSAAASMDIESIRALMWRGAGLFRTSAGLSETLAKLDGAYTATSLADCAADPEAWRRYNLLTVARLIARAALRREESRGGHFRQDFPERDDLHWQVHLIDGLHVRT
jgi:aspartate oxidase